MTKMDDNALAAEYVLGTLPDKVREAARLRIVEDRIFATAVKAWEDRLAPLASGAEMPPPDGLFDRIEAAIAARGAELPGTVTRRASSGTWKELYPGFRVRLLSRIEALNRQTIMIQLDAGTEYIPHEHSQDEECYVVSGDLVIGGLTLQAGDYHIARAGSRHPPSRTKTGCICIISQAIGD